MSDMKLIRCMPGCVFEHYGRIPDTVYHMENFNSPLEEAVYNNDVNLLRSLIDKGHAVSIRLRIGQMSCLEYAALKGYAEVLEALVETSVCAQMLRQYFALDDVVERAYLMSRNKAVFFEQEALVEANRYLAAFYTAIVYNHPKCVEFMLGRLGLKDPLARHSFYTADKKLEAFAASDLAQHLGHSECYRVIQKWQQRTVET